MGDVRTALATAADACRPTGAVTALAGRLPARIDAEYAMAVADHYDRALDASGDPETVRRYEVLVRNIGAQYEAILRAGISVQPWNGPGQPYRGSAELVEHVLGTGTVRLYPTGVAFGPGGSRERHPLQEPAGVRAGGLDLCHNDVLRVVHDLFGHVLHDASFGPAGEFLATYGHARFCVPEAAPVLFTEHVAQICWFWFGPHLRDRHGRLPRRGEPGYLPPERRPYPEQKVVAFPDDVLAGFSAGWEETVR